MLAVASCFKKPVISLSRVGVLWFVCDFTLHLHDIRTVHSVPVTPIFTQILP